MICVKYLRTIGYFNANMEYFFIPVLINRELEIMKLNLAVAVLCKLLM